MKPRIYIDTSVFWDYFDEVFSEHTIPLFDKISNGELILLYSSVTKEERSPGEFKNMKMNDKTFDEVKLMRQQREKLSEKLANMTKEEILQYFENRKSQATLKPGA